jgi:predicted cupin superfamily sugar epimerase
MAAAGPPPLLSTTSSRRAPGAPGTGSRPTKSGTTTTAARTRRLHRSDPQAVVPAGVWQAAEPESEAVLCGCTVAPGFDFADFELGRADELVTAYPHDEALIRRLLR